MWLAIVLLTRPSTYQLADSPARHRRVVGNDGEIALSLAHEFIDQALGRTDGHEPPDHEARAIWNQGDGVLKGYRFHARLPTLVLFVTIIDPRISASFFL